VGVDVDGDQVFVFHGYFSAFNAGAEGSGL